MTEDDVFKILEYSDYCDLDWSKDRICLDGHFTVEELEAIILFKKLGKVSIYR